MPEWKRKHRQWCTYCHTKHKEQMRRWCHKHKAGHALRTRRTIERNKIIRQAAKEASRGIEEREDWFMLSPAEVERLKQEAAKQAEQMSFEGTHLEKRKPGAKRRKPKG